MSSETEVWRPIPGFEGRYEASDLGRIRSLGFHVRMGHACGREIRFWKEGRVLVNSVVTSGHRRVVLVAEGGAQRTYAVHRLVLLAHVGPPPPGKPFGLHKDDDPSNNHLSNLYWGSPSENLHDSIRNGSHAQARKMTCALGHTLVAPNLVPSSSKHGNRSCLACKLARACHNHDEKLRAEGRERTRYNRGRDGFHRRRGESYEAEAHRRYAHIMGRQMS